VDNKKLDCRREVARCFVSLNICNSLTHSRLLKIIPNDTLEYGMYKCVLIFRCKCLHLVPFLRYSASNNGVTLKSGLGSFKAF